MTIHYPSILDMKDEIEKLNQIINSIDGVSIIEISHNLVAVSDSYAEYEYDSITEAIEEWSSVKSKAK